jgi:hypothetical protein
LAAVAVVADVMLDREVTLDTQVIKSPGVAQFKQLIVYKFILVVVVVVG